MNLRLLDLNLLIVFDMVYEERSVTRAAAKLNLTQSAISQALGRMRNFVKDELFVRTPDGMEPTSYAIALQGPVRAALDSLQTALKVAAEFEPETAEQAFTIAIDNRIALVMAAPLAAAVACEAPRVRLDLRPSRMIDIAGGLDKSELDLAIGGRLPAGERFAGQDLFDDRFVLLVRRGHPISGLGPLDPEGLAAYPHLSLTSTGEDDGFVDVALEKHGLRRRVELQAPLLSATAILTQSDLVVVVSERTARAFASEAPLDIIEMPFDPSSVGVGVVWHRRNEGVRAHRWIRDLVVRLGRSLA